MKRFLPYLFLSIILFGCDDGDLTVENINFEDAVARRCGTLLYKMAANEALILEINDEAALNEAVLSDATTAGSPRVYQIDSNHRVIYRSYDGDLATENICGSIPPATPSVVEEWTATSGTIEITTTPIINNNEEQPGGQIIIGYRHSIIFRNINFLKPNGAQQYEAFVFGDYTPTGFTPLPFNFSGTLEKCTSSNLVFDYTGNEALVLNIDPALIVNQATPAGSPRTGLLSATTNILNYIGFYSGPLTPEYFCTDPLPSTPVISEVWTGVDGMANSSGIIEVTTTADGANFIHEIRLKNVTFKKGNTTFFLATDYLFGQLTTTN
ncbi:MAG TPA: hypothetical protein VGB43_01085 [Flavobacterium sp.]